MKKGLYLLGLVAIIAIIGGTNGLTPRAKAEINCFIRFKVFDSKIYNPEIADSGLAKGGLVNKGDFVNAVQVGKLPFDSKISDSKLVNTIFDNLAISLCGKINGCDTKTLDMTVICDLGTGSAGNTIRDAQEAYNSRIAGMSTCQQGFFKNIQALNSQYVSDVRAANAKYYQQLAPRTAALLKAYRTADDKKKSAVLGDYIAYNQTLRKDLYKAQTIIFDKFISSRTTLQQGFNSCK